MTMNVSLRDNKYVVFKRDDWESDPGVAGVMLRPLDDAVVIRTKDPSAGPALHTYAAITAHSAMLMMAIDKSVAAKLWRRADYFHERAVEADDAYEYFNQEGGVQNEGD